MRDTSPVRENYQLACLYVRLCRHIEVLHDELLEQQHLDDVVEQVERIAELTAYQAQASDLFDLIAWRVDPADISDLIAKAALSQPYQHPDWGRASFPRTLLQTATYNLTEEAQELLRLLSKLFPPTDNQLPF